MACSVRNKLLLYADDSVILVSDKDPSVVSHELSKDLESCNHWLIDNQYYPYMQVRQSALSLVLMWS